MFTFIETTLFTRLVYDYLTDEEYAALQGHLLEQPLAGNVIPGSGGIRKIRWGQQGRGKRGGVRVIFFLQMGHGTIWLLTLYAKNEAANIPGHVLSKIREELEDA